MILLASVVADENNNRDVLLTCKSQDPGLSVNVQMNAKSARDFAAALLQAADMCEARIMLPHYNTRTVGNGD